MLPGLPVSPRHEYCLGRLFEQRLVCSQAVAAATVDEEPEEEQASSTEDDELPPLPTEGMMTSAFGLSE